MHIAVEIECVKIVKLLLDNKYVVNINSKDKMGDTALAIAANRGYGDIMKLILDHGAEIIIPKIYYYSFLVFGAAQNCQAIINQLTSRNLVDEDKKELVEVLMKVISLAASEKNLHRNNSFEKMLLEVKAPVEAKSKAIGNVFENAVKFEYINVVTMLLDYVVDNCELVQEDELLFRYEPRLVEKLINWSIQFEDRKFINFVAKHDIYSFAPYEQNHLYSSATDSPFYRVIDCYQNALSDNSRGCNSDNLHIHVIGDGKAGKSIATKWLIDCLNETDGNIIYRYLQQPAKQSAENLTIQHLVQPTEWFIDTSSFEAKSYDLHPEHSRTRGVKFTSFLGKRRDKYHAVNSRNYVIYDYGGQEEFLINHAKFLSVENSIYVLVVPLYDISLTDPDDETTLTYTRRSDDEIVKRYEYWLKFVYSVVINHRIENTSTSNNRCNVPDSKHKRIHLLIILNQFSSARKKEVSGSASTYDDPNQVLIDRLKSTSLFNIGSNFDGCNYDFITLADPLLLDCNLRLDLIKVARIVMDFEFFRNYNCFLIFTDFIKFMINQMDIHKCVKQGENELEPIRATQLLITNNYLRDLLSDWTDIYFSDFAQFKILNADMKQDLRSYLIKFCLKTFIAIKKIYILLKPIDGCSVITNPSLLTSSIMGDLLYWYHVCNKNNKTVIETKLTDDRVRQYLTVVHEKRKFIKSNKNSKFVIEPIETAIDILINNPKLPLCDLLVTMGLCVPDRKSVV